MSTDRPSTTDYVPIDRAAAEIGVPRAWLRKEATAGRVPLLRAGPRWLIDLPATRRILAERARRPGHPDWLRPADREQHAAHVAARVWRDALPDHADDAEAWHRYVAEHLGLIELRTAAEIEVAILALARDYPEGAR